MTVRCPNGHLDPIYVNDETSECAVCGVRYDAEAVPGKFYVADGYRVDGAYMSGPFDTRAEAEHDRRSMNIADDCTVVRAAG
jgi:hypothetical protein